MHQFDIDKRADWACSAALENFDAERLKAERFKAAGIPHPGVLVVRLGFREKGGRGYSPVTYHKEAILQAARGFIANVRHEFPHLRVTIRRGLVCPFLEVELWHYDS